MKLITPEQFYTKKDFSRQNFWQRVKRGTIDVVYKDVKVQKPFVIVEDDFDVSSDSGE